MRWRRHRDWPAYQPRPKVAKLTAETREGLLRKLRKQLDKSPVLKALRVEIVARRGRFYIEQVVEKKERFALGCQLAGRCFRRALPLRDGGHKVGCLHDPAQQKRIDCHGRRVARETRLGGMGPVTCPAPVQQL